MSEQELFDLRRRVGIVFQESALFDSLRVRENVAFRLMKNTFRKRRLIGRVREALRCGTERTIDMYPSSFRRNAATVAIARAIITQPEVLL